MLPEAADTSGEREAKLWTPFLLRTRSTTEDFGLLPEASHSPLPCAAEAAVHLALHYPGFDLAEGGVTMTAQDRVDDADWVRNGASRIMGSARSQERSSSCAL